MCFSLYLIRTRDIDLAFKIMLCCLLADRFQLNQEAERWNVRKRGQEWQEVIRMQASSGEGKEGQRKRDFFFFFFFYHRCAGTHIA